MYSVLLLSGVLSEGGYESAPVTDHADFGERIKYFRRIFCGIFIHFVYKIKKTVKFSVHFARTCIEI